MGQLARRVPAVARDLAGFGYTEVPPEFAATFPAPRQRWVDAMAHSEADIRAIGHRR
jgi:hypothetical protein